MRHELLGAPAGLDAQEEIVTALEWMAEQWDESNVTGARAAELLSQQSREWWEEAVSGQMERG
ncbi:hypothetical protein V3W47_16490 [Deinococcus sp. YIM 134068]|uniref:hypothetical protein n=1 Tax=Deinococcus lichenicola TaxID=3118910 RepID=UPI002F952F43